MQKINVRAVAEGALMIALAWALSYVKLDLWFQGGSISLVMIPLVIFAVRWGVGWGVGAGLIFGIIKFMLAGGWVIGWQSIVLDYTLAYAAAGLAGVMKGRKNGMLWGAIIGCFARFVIHYISGVTIYAEWMPEQFMGITMTSPFIYSALYNGGYMLPNGIAAAVAGFLLQKPLKRFPTTEKTQS